MNMKINDYIVGNYNKDTNSYTNITLVHARMEEEAFSLFDNVIGVKLDKRNGRDIYFPRYIVSDQNSGCIEIKTGPIPVTLNKTLFNLSTYFDYTTFDRSFLKDLYYISEVHIYKLHHINGVDIIDPGEGKYKKDNAYTGDVSPFLYDEIFNCVTPNLSYMHDVDGTLSTMSCNIHTYKIESCIGINCFHPLLLNTYQVDKRHLSYISCATLKDTFDDITHVELEVKLEKKAKQYRIEYEIDSSNFRYR